MGSRVRAARAAIAGLSSRPDSLAAAFPPLPAAQARRTFTCSTSIGSGSNRWSKIRHTKAAKDLAKGSSYGSLSREIIAAVRNHPTRSTSPDTNAKLGILLRRAKSMSVTKDKLEETLRKAESMGNAAANGTAISFEALGPVSNTGVPLALIIECQTDSPSRTLLRVREAFSKTDVRLTSAAHMFQRHGVVRLTTRPGTTFDSVFEAAVEHGAEDVREWEADEDEDIEDDEGTPRGIGIEILCDRSNLQSITSILSSEPHGHTIIESEAKMLPTEPPMLIRSTVDDEEDGRGNEDNTLGLGSGWLSEERIPRLERMIDSLHENADCTRIWSNVEGWPSR